MPGSPAWDLKGDLAGRAMRLIADGVIEREGVPGLARHLGYGERQLRRQLDPALKDVAQGVTVADGEDGTAGQAGQSAQLMDQAKPEALGQQ